MKYYLQYHEIGLTPLSFSGPYTLKTTSIMNRISFYLIITTLEGFKVEPFDWWKHSNLDDSQLNLESVTDTYDSLKGHLHPNLLRQSYYSTVCQVHTNDGIQKNTMDSDYLSHTIKVFSSSLLKKKNCLRASES